MRKFQLNFVWVLIAAIFVTASCKKDDSGSSNLIEDGMYVMGANTPYADLNGNALMKVGINEVGQKPRAGMYELYMTVKTGVGGFNIVEKAGAVEKIYGPNAVSSVTLTGQDDPKVTIQIGTFKETTNKFTVPADGLYHIVIDKKRGVVAIIPVDHWAVIGAATALGWGGETALPLKGTFNLTSMEFEKTNVKMDKGEFKFRYGNGWKVALSGDSVKVNTNLGGASLTELTPGGNNINWPGTSRGFYTINVKWTATKGVTVALTKTGSIEPTNYTAIKFGIIGNCYKLEDGTTQASWNVNWKGTVGTIAPVVTNTTTYTWTYDHVVLVAPTAGDMEFKFRQDDNWDGKSIGYGAVTKAGAAAANFVDKGGNFKCTVAGDYKFVLVIDAVTENYTLTITKY